MFYDTGVSNGSPKEILLVEDNPGDARLIETVIEDLKQNIHLNIVMDGNQAMDFLYKRNNYIAAPTPHLILLDLNLPKKSGREILAEIKNDKLLKYIPVIVLTISSAEDDILSCYNLQANCYISKPFDIDKLMQIFKAINHFWFNVVTLPPRKETEIHE